MGREHANPPPSRIFGPEAEEAFLRALAESVTETLDDRQDIDRTIVDLVVDELWRRGILIPTGPAISGRVEMWAQCTCGGMLHVISDPGQGAIAARFLFDRVHQGEGHEPCDARTAMNARRRKARAEIRRLRRERHAAAQRDVPTEATSEESRPGTQQARDEARST